MKEKVRASKPVRVPHETKKQIKKSAPVLLQWIRKKLGGYYENLTEEENRHLKELRKQLKQLLNDDMEKPVTAQRSIPFKKMFSNGICYVGDGYYTKMVGFCDINYDLLEIEDQGSLLETYSKLINFFTPDIHFVPFMFNRLVENDYMTNRFRIKRVADGLNPIRDDIEKNLINKSKRGTNGIQKSKFIIFGIKSVSYKDAKKRLEGIETEVIRYLNNMNCDAFKMSGTDRLRILYEYFNQSNIKKFDFSYQKAKEEHKSVKDYIAPELFDFSKYDCFMSGDMYGASYYVDLTGAKLFDDLLKKILDKDANLSVSLHFDTYDPVEGNKLLKETLTDVQKMKIDEQKKAVRAGYDMDIMSIDIITFEEALLECIKDLNGSNQKLLKVSFLVNLFGKTKEELDNLYQSINGIVGSEDNALRLFEYQQESGFMSCAPIGQDTTGIIRYLVTKNAAVLVPFSTQELFMPFPALFYGINQISENMIMADRKKLRNPNGLILGTPGSGKSYATKLEMLFVRLFTDDDILICDPEGEYFSLVDALGGQTIMLSAVSKKYINPMDIELINKKGDPGFDREYEDALINKSDFIISLCDFLAGGKAGLDNFDKGIVDSCIENIYQKYYENPIPENMPILEDLYNELINFDPENGLGEEYRAKEALEKAIRIGNSLYLYVKGSQNYFNHRSNVDHTNRVISFDLRDLGKQLREIGMMVVQDIIWNRVSVNRDKKKSTRYYCDEFHLLLARDQTAAYQVEIWKRFRKWGGIPTGITQNVNDLLKSPEIEEILENSDFILLLNLGDKSQNIIADHKKLSNKQLEYVTSSPPGSGLILYDKIVIPFTNEFPENTYTHQLLTTKMEESMARENNS